MSTKRIREALARLEKDGWHETWRLALAEVEAIESAAHQFYLNGEEANVEAWALMDDIGHEHAERTKR